jgi:hypothetical protein
LFNAAHTKGEYHALFAVSEKVNSFICSVEIFNHAKIILIASTLDTVFSGLKLQSAYHQITQLSFKYLIAS